MENEEGNMDKNKIKSFAVWARRTMLAAVCERANKLGIYEDSIKEAVEISREFSLKDTEEVFPFFIKEREALINKIKQQGFQQVIEEVAAIWFIRFMALRYLEINEYLPSGIRIFSSKVKGEKIPEILPRAGEGIDELKLNDKERAYTKIILRECDKLGNLIPDMFQQKSSYEKLLFPDNLLKEDSVIRKMVEEIGEEDWLEEVEILGWMYQYYLSEKKDEVFAGLKSNIKIAKENIPAATQLFTPKWIVKYMVENSLGRLWLEGHPNERLQRSWKYYLEEGDQTTEVEGKLKLIREEHGNLTPEAIKVLDPCMGSGHILVYAFDLLYEIYRGEGYEEKKIPRLILENNLYGLDIDNRAAQLTSFALIMKARAYNSSFFNEIEKEPIRLNFASIEESNDISKEALDYFTKDDEELKGTVTYLVQVFTNAKEYGSILEVKKINVEPLKKRLREIEQDNSLVYRDCRSILLEKLPPLIKQGKIMGEAYEVCITNPPYMGLRGMNKALADYLTKNYPQGKYDLFSVYMEICLRYNTRYGLTSMINQHSWMFLSSFSEFRMELLKTSTFISLLHLGSRAFEENVGTIVQNVAYVNRKGENINYKSKVIDLTKELNSQDKRKKLEEIIIKEGSSSNKVHGVCLQSLSEIPGVPFAYWVNDKILSTFSLHKNLGEVVKPRQGIATSDNNRFLRLWFEVNEDKINLTASSAEEALRSGKKWFPYNKGGSFRKWYGNNEYLINWEDNGREIKEYAAALYKSYSRTIKNEDFYFKRGLTYTFISEYMGVRYFDRGFIFDVAGSSIFFENEEIMKAVLALLVSKVSKLFIDIMNPTFNIQVRDIKNIPINNRIFEGDNLKQINDLVEENILISKNEWDSFETSWDFKTHPLLKENKQNNLSETFKAYKTKREEAFQRLKENETKLNEIFIFNYGLEKELSPEVQDKDITISKAEVERDIKSFISYGIGCIFGRYSLDLEGLIYAGGAFERKWDFQNKRVSNGDAWVNSRFVPEEGNILIITKEEYDKADIVSMFQEFLKSAFGEEVLEENLEFIAKALGKKAGETSREVLRRYFMNDFYKDHLKSYGKRPIYWLFDSGKNHGFKALIYLHRYRKETLEIIEKKYLQPIEQMYEVELKGLQDKLALKLYSAKEEEILKKNIHRLENQLTECKEYGEALAFAISKKLSLNLDDGVKSNYNKFQNIKVINSKEIEVKKNLLGKI